MANNNGQSYESKIACPSGRSYTVTAKEKLQWSTDLCPAGDTVTMLARVAGHTDKTKAVFAVYALGDKGEYILAKDNIQGEVLHGKTQADWAFQFDDQAGDALSLDTEREENELPGFVFTVTIDDKVFRCEMILRCYGGPLFVDEAGIPIKEMGVIALLSDERMLRCKIHRGYLTNPYLWNRGKVRFHLVSQSIGGIEEQS
jgi:hypothetical protein